MPVANLAGRVVLERTLLLMSPPCVVGYFPTPSSFQGTEQRLNGV